MCPESATLNQPSPNRSPRLLSHRWRRRGATVAALTGLALALGSCVTDSHREQAGPPPDQHAAAPDVSPVAYCQLPLADTAAHDQAQIWDRLRGGFVLWDINHPRLEHELERLRRHPAALSAMLEAARPWLYHIVQAVERHQLPMELALLPAVESGYRPYAHSRSGAAGLWQFMPATGRWRGLTLDWWYDGRRDVVDGTEAALKHLQFLNRRMGGNWLHTLASYNAGRGTVNRAIRRNRQKGAATDYWSLDLPDETNSYVPRLLALSAVIAAPERFGVTLPDIPDRPQFAVVDIKDQIDLGVAAKLAEVPLTELAALNAGLNRLATPPKGPHRLLIPTDKAHAFQLALTTLPKAERLQRDRYRVKRGDTLSTIAARNDLSTSALKTANALNNNRIRVGQYLLIPRYPSALALAPVAAPKLPHSRVRYRVRHGDSLYDIARKFRVSVGQLRRWNRLNGNLVRPGQRLTLFVDPAKQTL